MPEAIILNNRYQLEDRLGAGGMAMVYRARDLMLERTVALKILRKDFSSDPEFRERFRQEAKAAANLSHPNIVTVHDFGLDADRLFIVMEYVPGTDLKTILQRRGRLGISEGLGLIVQACAGIGYAHRAGLVHCDVKPQNMLVTPDKRLKVVDFGIARALASIQPDERAEVVWGSPQYFSPEQAAGGAPSPASDVYSLGVVMFELLTGQLPFIGSTPEELARMHREVPPPSPRKLNPAIPLPLEQILLKVLSKEPAARYRTADQLGRVLVTITQQAGSGSILPTYNQAEDSDRQERHDPAETRPVVSLVSPDPPVTDTAPAINRSVPSPVQAYPRPVPIQPRSLPQETYTPPPPIYVEPEEPAFEFDWATWLLGLLALIAVIGLVPFWLWVYTVLNPPL